MHRQPLSLLIELTECVLHPCQIVESHCLQGAYNPYQMALAQMAPASGERRGRLAAPLTTLQCGRLTDGLLCCCAGQFAYGDPNKKRDGCGLAAACMHRQAWVSAIV
jgi:hypothetical protein